ncbi:uncharacterized protein LOC106672488 isoform X2 [Cimex lectularius]|nr:uncharacterized protein LOC106672488 isoform X2 [Cimex lectularius]
MSVEMWRDERERDKKLATEIAGTLPPGNRFTSGKSCLFPMMPTDMIKTIQRYPLEVQVIRMSVDKSPSHVIGHTKVELGANFKEAVTLATMPVVLPVSAYIEDKFSLLNVFGDDSGEVWLFIRLSCFGATIFTQFKYIQGEKGGIKSKMTETGKNKKSLAEKKRKEEEERRTVDQQRTPYICRDDNLPGTGGCSKGTDDFFIPVQWRNINEPEVNIQLCYPPDYPQEVEYQDGGYKCAMANNETSNMNRMFPGMQQKYNQRGFVDTKCPCPGAKPHEETILNCCFNPPSNKGNKTAPGKANASPNLKSLDTTYLSENVETVEEITVNDATSKAISDLVDSDWELMVSGQSERKTKRPQVYPRKINCPPFLKAPNPKGCPASADGRCRCPKDSQQKKPRTTECSDRRCNQRLQTSRNPGYPGGQGGCPVTNCGNLNETGAMLAGLPRLCDPIMQNINNVMPPNVIVPQSSGGPNVVSICTCPKVPDFIPPGEMRGPADGLNIRCECSNILTSVHPVKVPYTCPGTTYESNKQMDMARGQVVPCPVNIPEPPQEAQQTQQAMPMPPTCVSSLPSLVLSDESTSDDDFQYVEQKRHLKAKGGKKKKEKESDTEPLPSPKKSKKKSPSTSVYDSSDRTDFDSTAQKMLEEELDFYESMVNDVKNKAKGGGDTKSVKGKKDGNSSSSVNKDKPKADDEKKDNTLYRYTAGMYPGVHIGHKDCIVPYRMVPKNMGWLWNIKNAAGILKAGRGWRPGAIAESVAELMDAAKSTTQKSKKKSRKPPPRKKKEESELHKQPGKKTAKMLKEERKDKDNGDKSPEDLRPTLHVHKKHGLYYVSMFPPKKEDEAEPQPIQFKIDPKHPDGPGGGDSSMFETEDTSTNSEDSFQLEFVAPHTLKGRIPPKTKQDMQCQVSTEQVIIPPTPSVNLKTPKGGKKATGKGKKGKGKKGGKGGKKGKGKKSKK